MLTRTSAPLSVWTRETSGKAEVVTDLNPDASEVAVEDRQVVARRVEAPLHGEALIECREGGDVSLPIGPEDSARPDEDGAVVDVAGHRRAERRQAHDDVDAVMLGRARERVDLGAGRIDGRGPPMQPLVGPVARKEQLAEDDQVSILAACPLDRRERRLEVRLARVVGLGAECRLGLDEREPDHP